MSVGQKQKSGWRAGLGIVLLTFVYFAAARLSLLLDYQNTHASPVWAPSGIAFAAILLFGTRLWPGIFLGAFAANFTLFWTQHAYSFPLILQASVFIGAGNSLEALAGAYLRKKWIASPHPILGTSDVFKFAGIGLMMGLVGSAVGPAVLCMAGIVPASLYATTALTWWLGDSAGIIILTPVLLTFSKRSSFQGNPRLLLEAALLLSLMLAIGATVFGMQWGVGRGHYPLEYLFIPLVFWAAFRMGEWGVAVSTLAVCSIAIAGTLHGFGPFVRSEMNESLLLLQTFVGTVSLTGWILSAILYERRRAETAIKASHALLEERVSRNTSILRQTNDSLHKEISKHQAAKDELHKAYRQLERSQEAALNIMEDLDRERRELAKINTALSLEITDRKKAEGSIHRKNMYMMLLQVIAVAANQSSGVHEAIQTCLEKICVHTEWRAGHAYEKTLVNNRERMVSMGLWFSNPAGEFQSLKEISKTQPVVLGKELAGTVWGSGVPVWIQDLPVQPDLPRYREAAACGMKSAIAFPVLVGKDVVHVLEFFSKEALVPDVYFTEMMVHIGAQIGRVVERGRAEENLRQAYDNLEMLVAQRTQELSKTVAELKVANERLKQIDQMKSDFISAASHELRTPLTAIKGYVALVLKGKVGVVNEKQTEFLNYVKDATDRLHRLLNELLDISRMESGKVQPNLTETDLAGLLREEVGIYEVQAQDKQIRITLEIDPDLKSIVCDCDKIREVAGNLIHNAIKYTPAQGSILIRAANAPEGVQVDVQDTGIGILEEDQKKIFEPFQMIAKTEASSEESTGLGLTLVKKIIDLHHGSISVRSQRGKGSRFTFVLPEGKARQMAA